jgi:hypothetical protein
LRFYTMLFLFSALSYLFFIRAFKTLQVWNFVGYTLATIGLLYTHYYGIAIFIIQGLTFIALVIFFKRDIRFVVYSVLSAVLVIVGFIPWIPVILNDLGISNFWLKKPSPLFLFDYFYNYTGKDVATTAIWVVLVVFFIRSRRTIQENHKALLVIVLMWLALSYIIPYLRSIISVPMLHIRYTIVALPAWIIVFALGWESIQKQRLKFVLVLLIPLAAILNLIIFRKHYTKVTKQQFRETSQVIKEKNSVHYPVYSSCAWHFNFYFRGDSQKVLELSQADLSAIEGFWLLQVQFFNPAEMNQGLERFLHDFEVSETYSFKSTNAVFLKRRKN